MVLSIVNPAIPVILISSKIQVTQIARIRLVIPIANGVQVTRIANRVLVIPIAKVVQVTRIANRVPVIQIANLAAIAIRKILENVQTKMLLMKSRMIHKISG